MNTTFPTLLLLIIAIIKFIYEFFCSLKSLIYNIFNFSHSTKTHNFFSQSENAFQKKKVAIYAIYSKSKLHPNVINTCNTLKKNNYKIVIVHAGEFDYETKEFENICDILLVKKNIGKDWISYSYALDFLKFGNDKINANSVLFLNDSVFYFQSNFQKYLIHSKNSFNLDGMDIYAPYIIQEFHSHITGWCFELSNKIVNEPDIQKFFKDCKYIHLSRPKALLNTEIKFSKILFNISKNIGVYYDFKNYKKIRHALKDNSFKINILGSKDIYEQLKNNHITHFLALDFLRYMDGFFIKKDLMYKSNISHSSIFKFINDFKVGAADYIIDDEQIILLKEIMRKFKNKSNLSIIDKYFYLPFGYK